MKKYCLSLLFVVVTVFASAQQADAGPDKATCSESVEIGNMTEDPDLCYSWKASPADPNLTNTTSPKIKVRPTRTTTYTLTVIGKDFSKKSSDDVKVFVVNSIKLKEVSYSGNHDIMWDNSAGIYAAPHWAGETPKPAPVCYASGTAMSLSAIMEMDTDIGAGITIIIRGKNKDGYNLPSTPVISAGKTIELPPTTVSKAFPAKKVDFLDPFIMEWEVSFDDEKTWCKAGEHKNPVYVTLGTPIIDANTPNIYYTVVHLGCKNAKGQSNENVVFKKVWEEFKDRDVKRVDGTRLTYYNDWKNLNIITAALLKHGDGQCGSWVKLFLDVLKVQGIQRPGWYVGVVYSPAGGFLVKKWSFKGKGTSGEAAYPYLNIPGVNLVKTDAYDWHFAEVTDVPGLPGQGTVNPASLFANHQLITFNKRFYDPSYGTETATILGVDNKSIEALFEGKFKKIKEKDVGKDLNEDGDTDDTLTVMVHVIKKNPVGQDITELTFDY